MQRQNKSASSGFVAVEPKHKDAEVQCELISTHSAAKLQKQLQAAKLQLIAVKGDLASARRAAGMRSSSSNNSDSNSSSQTHGSVAAETDEDKGEEAKEDEQEQETDMEESSLDDTVEVGDVAEIVNLQTDAGKQLNGRYGKVVSYHSATGRFGVQLKDGRNVAIRAENLSMGMKEEELSEEDEKMLLSLEPAPEELRCLPHVDRMAALYGPDRFGNAEELPRRLFHFYI